MISKKGTSSAKLSAHSGRARARAGRAVRVTGQRVGMPTGDVLESGGSGRPFAQTELVGGAFAVDSRFAAYLCWAWQCRRAGPGGYFGLSVIALTWMTWKRRPLSSNGHGPEVRGVQLCGGGELCAHHVFTAGFFYWRPLSSSWVRADPMNNEAPRAWPFDVGTVMMTTV